MLPSNYPQKVQINMDCRLNCGMCCIAPSINSRIPGMPYGKPAGQACIHLDLSTFKCNIWGTKQYPKFCRDFEPEITTCGHSQEEARELLTLLEKETSPE